MIFNNYGIKIYDTSLYQAVLFEYVDGKRILLPPEKQKHIDFNKMKQKASACILKCGQRDYKDPAFDVGWRNAKNAGIPRGSYWFCDKYLKGKAQAQTYWSYIKHDIGEGILAADFETGSWTNWQELYNFVSELQQLSGLSSEKIAIYTGYYYFMQYYPQTASQREWFSQFPLWLASYTTRPDLVKVPPLWSEVLIWQYGTPVEGLESGVHSLEIDGNYFNGNKDKFEKYFGKMSETIPPEDETPIVTKKYFIVDYKDKKVTFS